MNNDRTIPRRTWQLDAFVDVIGLTPRAPLASFPEMWYQIYLWALFSSLLVHAIAVVIAFTTLRKHHFGKWFPVVIIVVGMSGPLVAGAFSSGAIAFVYRAASLQMSPLYACLWGVGQTLLSAAIGFTRILATLEVRRKSKSIVCFDLPLYPHSFPFDSEANPPIAFPW